MILARSGVKVMNVEYGKGEPEIVNAKVRRKNGDNIKLMRAYVQEEILNDILDIIKEITGGCKNAVIHP